MSQLTSKTIVAAMTTVAASQALAAPVPSTSESTLIHADGPIEMHPEPGGVESDGGGEP